MPQSEPRARERIDRLLAQAGWHVYGAEQVDLASHRGVAIQEFPLRSGHSFADYPVLRAFRDKLPEIFPGRTWSPRPSSSGRVRRKQTNIRCMFAPPNGWATKSWPTSFERSGRARERGNMPMANCFVA